MSSEPDSWDRELPIVPTASMTEPTEVSLEDADLSSLLPSSGALSQWAEVELQRAPPTSASYRIPRSVFASGGGGKISTHYVMNTTQGQSTALNRRQSASYVLVPGYWSRWTPLAYDFRVYLPLVVKDY